MTTAMQLIKLKGTQVWSVSPTQTVYEAVRIMSEKDVGSLLVMEGKKLVGIITERHYARNVVLKGRTSPDTLIRDIMGRSVVCARPEQSVEACMDLMTRHHVRHLPVLDKGQVVGIVSIGDLVKCIIDSQNFTIGQLENYISGESRAH
jgi:CBS domain-containing protein